LNAGAGDQARHEWVRYWRPDGLPVEVMHAHFTRHAYHRHSHQTYSFGVTESGAQAFWCRNGGHVSTAGLVMAFNADDPHDGHAASPEGFTYRMVHIDQRAFAGAPLPLFREPVLDAPRTAHALRMLIAAVTGQASDLARAERLDAAVALLRGHVGGPLPSASAPAPAGAALIAARVRSLLHENAPQGVTMDEISAVAGCDRYTVYRAFMATYGLAPSDYQRQLRLRTARALLRAGARPADAAAQAGFADQAHLTRWFGRCYGITPAAYASAAR